MPLCEEKTITEAGTMDKSELIEKLNEYSTHSEPHRPTLRATYSII